MDKKQAREIVKQYLIEHIENQIAITDQRPDGVYLPSEGEFWYCHMPNQRPSIIGSGRVIVVSKVTGKVVFDGYCGE